jgi:hypothetical protein
VRGDGFAFGNGAGKGGGWTNGAAEEEKKEDCDDGEGEG